VGKRLLVILGIAAVAGYLFRDQIIAVGLELGAKLSDFKEDLGWTGDGEDYPDLYNATQED